MDSFLMPDAAFKADKRETEESFARLDKRISDLESGISRLAEILLEYIKIKNTVDNA